MISGLAALVPLDLNVSDWEAFPYSNQNRLKSTFQQGKLI
jgi:hypothetical protein